MKTYRQLCDGKMWKAVDFMIKGLEAVESIPHRETMLSTFGNYNLTEDICYGCIATAACEAASGVVYDRDSIQAPNSRAVASLKPTYDEEWNARKDQEHFEDSIDELRIGNAVALFEYMYPEYEIPEGVWDNDLPSLCDDAWPEDIHRYAQFRDFLKELDL